MTITIISNTTRDTRTLNKIIQLISEKTGLRIQEQDIEKFSGILASRMKSFKISDADEYYHLLKGNNTAGNLEWEYLVTQITIGESYFFRDKGQMSLLKNWILPRLIDRRKEGHSIRIWSAGCSTGEEPYSIAIMVDEHIPHRENWDIRIIGTDINKEALERAKLGIYSKWSLRGVSSETKKRYFHSQKKGWELDERIRKMVTFEYHNLVKDDFPGARTEIYKNDLIICRNALIYFNTKTVATVLVKLSSALGKGSYLITGHTELCGHKLEKLKTMIFPESIVYRRTSESEHQDLYLGKRESFIVSELPTPLELKPAKTKSKIDNKKSKTILPETVIPKLELPDLQSRIAEAEALLKKGVYAGVKDKIEPLMRTNPRNYDIYYLLARLYANLGKYEDATLYCKQAIEIDVLAVKPYFLLANVQEALGNNGEAKNLLKKAIYLDPSYIPAYLELGALYERDNNPVRSEKMRTTALKLLNAIPPDVNIAPYNDMTSRELVLYIQKMIEK